MKPVIGAILAGGRGRRMGEQAKPLIHLGGKPLISHVIDRLTPQVDALVINTNDPPGVFDRFDLPVVRDLAPDHPGPLAGIHASLSWAVTQQPSVRSVAITAADTPFIPQDLVQVLSEGDDSLIAIAASRGNAHWTTGLFPVDAVPWLEEIFRAPALPRTQDWIRSRPHRIVAFEDLDGIDPFYNINTPEELATAETLLDR